MVSPDHHVRADSEPVPSSFVSVLVAQALRARGGMFRLPMARLTWSELEAATDERRLRRFCAEPTAEDAVDATATRMGRRRAADDVGLCLVLGSEGQGLSADALRICRPVAIPMPGEMESLNVGVAGGYSCISCDDDDRTFGDEKRGTRNERRGTGRFGSRRGTSRYLYESFGEF